MAEASWKRARAALPADALVAGVDEVGRGPLAGDVVAAAVILGAGVRCAGLADSKALSAPRRERIARQVLADAACVSIGRATPGEIDQLNILAASLLAMTRAVRGLALAPALVLVDGNRLPDWEFPARPVVRGDALVPEISAASIVAKKLPELDARWPGYGFARHKGYPTRMHLEALARLGPTPLHRRSFRPVRETLARLEMP